MKKDRNCGNDMFPIYPMQTPQMVMPNIGFPQQVMPSMVMPYSQNTQQSNSLDQMNNLSNQISNLEKRVSSLERIVGNTNYNTSNFQMM